MATQSRLTSFFPTKKQRSNSPSSKRMKLDSAGTTSSSDFVQQQKLKPSKKKNVKVSSSTSSSANRADVNDDRSKELPEKEQLKTPQVFDETVNNVEEVFRKRKQPIPLYPEPPSVKQSTGQSEPCSAKRRLKFSRKIPALEGEDLEKSEAGPTSCTKLAPLILPQQRLTTEPPNKLNLSSTEAPSKLNPSEVRKKLGSVKNLQELRSKLASFSDVANKLNLQKKERDTELLAETKAELLAASSKKQNAVTPKKSPYAFEKFAALVEKSRSELDLPPHYQMLMEMFRSTETLVSMMSGRDELITFEKLKISVQQMMKRNFETKHLGQMKTVYPEAYEYRLLKLMEKFGQRSRQERFHLVLSPNLETDLINCNKKTPQKTPVKSPTKNQRFALHVSPRKVVQEISPRKTPEKFLSEKKRLTIDRQVVRREIFRNGLLKVVKEHHREFLKCQNPPVELTPEEEAQMQRWNPRFLAVFSKIPEIPVGELPQMPTEHKVVSAKELLNETRDSLPESTKRALELSIAAKSATASDKQASKTKGISMSLLQKIRAKQALSEKLEQLSTPSENLRKLRLSRLPDIVRILRNTFLTERKNSLRVPDVRTKLADSYGQLSSAELDAHLELLIEVLPEWISRAEIPGKGVYLKIRKETKVTDLLVLIEKAK